jgi:hypothetical protein
MDDTDINFLIIVFGTTFLILVLHFMKEGPRSFFRTKQDLLLEELQQSSEKKEPKTLLLTSSRV